MYPIILYSIPNIQTVYSASGSGKGDLNINVQDSLSYSVTHKYLFLELPVYVNNVNIRLLNQAWCFAVILESFLFIYFVIEYLYGRTY